MTGDTVPVLHDIGYAKINLALHVRHRRDDGYHALETLFAFAQDGDALTVRPSDGLSLSLSGPFAKELGDGGDNLVLRAAHGLRTAAGISAGAALHLEKRLPVAAGLGGGSADAAAALRLLSRLWGLDDRPAQLIGLAASLGADVPACVASRTCFGSGVGDQLMAVDAGGLAAMPILLVNPLQACPTGPVFKAWDGLDRGRLDPAHWRLARNDLEEPAIGLVPEIAQVLAALRALPGNTLVRMSGSGATCFALFADQEALVQAEAAMRADHPHWWTMGSRVR